ncbi:MULTISPECIES: M23 family metallopeptidase [Thermocrispum]|uniref:M23 family metallopeptidase n=2 Tax=Thermocrispum agreste TaxID=37925 RepID=A0ABD6FEM6_9PSEU|nr:MULTISPECIES: M23 family metallopeptidase [Thermocrispum]
MRRRRVVAAVIAAGALAPIAQALGSELSAEPTAVTLHSRATPQPNTAAAMKREEERREHFEEQRRHLEWLAEKRKRAKAKARAEARAKARAKALADKRAEQKRQERAKARQAAASPEFVKPTTGRLTSAFGPRSDGQHGGIDVANALGTPIYAVADGTVVEAGPASGFGKWVRIKHDDGTVTVYGHMFEFSVRAGERVEAGEQIAEIGNNGQSTGPHLHFEVWQHGSQKIDPLAWLNQHGVRL